MKCAIEEDPGERTDNHVEVEGVVHRFLFRKDRLEENKHVVKELLGELPDKFHKWGGGGYSLLGAHVDRHGHHWGEHRSVEVLVVFGLALGFITVPVPRVFWKVLPGGLPYIIVDVGKKFPPKEPLLGPGTVVRAAQDLDPSGADVKKGMVGIVRVPSNEQVPGTGPCVAWENGRTCSVRDDDVEIVI